MFKHYFPLWLLQNIGCDPQVAQYILVALVFEFHNLTSGQS